MKSEIKQSECKEKIKILNVLMDNYYGGPQVRVFDSYWKLLENNVQNIILLPKVSGNASHEASKRGLQYVQLAYDHPHKFKSLKSIFRNIKWVITFVPSILSISFLILNKKIDIVQVNGVTGLQAALAAKLTRKKLIWFLIGNVYPQWFLKLLIPFVVVFSDKIVFVTSKLQKYYLSKHLDSKKTLKKIINIPTFVNENRFKFSNVSLKYASPLNAPLGSINLMTVGNISPIKGYHILVKIAEIIINKYSNAHFFIAGGVPSSQYAYYSKLKTFIDNNRISSNFHFLDHRNDIPELLKNSDIFILPSLKEGTPISILEAMICRLPVVATDVGGVTDFVQHNKTGYIYSPGDINLACSYITDLIEDKSLRITLGNNGRDRVLKDFTIDIFINNHLQLYKSVYYDL